MDFVKGVEIYPCVGGSYVENISGESHILTSSDAKNLITQLCQMVRLTLITDTLQSLCQRHDGTKLQTALPLLNEIKECIASGLVLPQYFVEKVTLWEARNCTVINLDFPQLSYHHL